MKLNQSSYQLIGGTVQETNILFQDSLGKHVKGVFEGQEFEGIVSQVYLTRLHEPDGVDKGVGIVVTTNLVTTTGATKGQPVRATISAEYATETNYRNKIVATSRIISLTTN